VYLNSENDALQLDCLPQKSLLIYTYIQYDVGIKSGKRKDEYVNDLLVPADKNGLKMKWSCGTFGVNYCPKAFNPNSGCIHWCCVHLMLCNHKAIFFNCKS